MHWLITSQIRFIQSGNYFNEKLHRYRRSHDLIQAPGKTISNKSVMLHVWSYHIYNMTLSTELLSSGIV